MHPIPGVVEKKVAQSAWTYVRTWFKRNRDLQKQVESLQAQLAEERTGKLAFEKLMGELVCHPENDNMYWKIDGSGGPYCPLCLHSDQKLIPLTHGFEGSYYCRLHDHFFKTQECRIRRSNYVARPRTWRATKRKQGAESHRQGRWNW